MLTTLLAIGTLIFIFVKLARLHQARIPELTFLFIFYLAAIEVFILVLQWAYFTTLQLHFFALYIHIIQVRFFFLSLSLGRAAPAHRVSVSQVSPGLLFLWRPDAQGFASA